MQRARLENGAARKETTQRYPPALAARARVVCTSARLAHVRAGVGGHSAHRPWGQEPAPGAAPGRPWPPQLRLSTMSSSPCNHMTGRTFSGGFMMTSPPPRRQPMSRPSDCDTMMSERSANE